MCTVTVVIYLQDTLCILSSTPSIRPFLSMLQSENAKESLVINKLVSEKLSLSDLAYCYFEFRWLAKEDAKLKWLLLGYPGPFAWRRHCYTVNPKILLARFYSASA